MLNVNKYEVLSISLRCTKDKERSEQRDEVHKVQYGHVAYGDFRGCCESSAQPKARWLLWWLGGIAPMKDFECLGLSAA